MNQEKAKQIAPQVVLAQHENKNAMREIYMQYYKNIFFISNILTGSMTEATQLTATIFTEMFKSISKLDDHMAFEKWFYSLSINICSSHMKPDCEYKEIVTEQMKQLADTASQSIKAKDKYGFEHSVMKIIGEMISVLPSEAKVLILLSKLASLDNEQIAVLEKTEPSDIEKRTNAINIIFDRQCEQLKAFGVDISPFLRDISATLNHLAAKTFVPDSVHSLVSAQTGVNTDPFSEKQENEVATQDIQPEDKKKKKAKHAKKNPFSKSDLIIFVVALFVAAMIFSGVKIYRSVRENESNASAQEAQTVVKPVLTWNGAAASSFESGSGTEEDPYIIASGGQLAYLANLVNDGNSYYSSCSYKLGCDIVLNDSDSYQNRWTPIGKDDNGCFTGTFDGNGHSVSGMYINGEYTYSGLFGHVKNGCIKNLTVKNSYINAQSNCGGIVGCFNANVNLGANIENCSFSGKIVSSGENTGAIVGKIEADGDKNFILISSCCASGVISGEGKNVGGIAGYVYANSGDIKISDCFSSAEINSENENCGGIAGCINVLSGDCSVYTCYNSGDISSSNDETAGGITGTLMCESTDGVITIMYCTSLTSAAPTLTGMSVADNFVIKSIRNASGEEMRSSDAFEMFDFDTVWKFDEDSNYSYPVLTDCNYIQYSYSENYTGQ